MDDIQRTIDYFKEKIRNGISKHWLGHYKTAISAMEELQQYRELEEQGWLSKLPCAIGDTV